MSFNYLFFNFSFSMKTVKYLSIIFVACLALLACGDDPDDPQNPLPDPKPTQGGKFITLNHNMPATASQETISLTGLTSDITKMAGQNDAPWLIVSKEPYTSGTPKVTLRTLDNPDSKVRSAFVVFVAARDTLALTVKQAAYSGGEQTGGTDVDNPHDSTTDQPAYARRQ